MLAASCRQLQASSLCSPKMSTTVIRNGRIIDPVNRRDEIGDLVIANGRVADQSAIRNQNQKSKKSTRVDSSSPPVSSTCTFICASQALLTRKRLRPAREQRPRADSHHRSLHAQHFTGGR